MATELKDFNIGILAASADLRTKQHRAVKVSGNLTVDVVSASTQLPLGVLQNKPNTGEIADVAIVGVTKMVLGATVAAGAEVMADANGAAITLAANAGTNRALGQCLNGGTVGQVVEILLTGGSSRAL